MEITTSDSNQKIRTVFIITPPGNPTLSLTLGSVVCSASVSLPGFYSCSGRDASALQIRSGLDFCVCKVKAFAYDPTPDSMLNFVFEPNTVLPCPLSSQLQDSLWNSCTDPLAFGSDQITRITISFTGGASRFVHNLLLVGADNGQAADDLSLSKYWVVEGMKEDLTTTRLGSYMDLDRDQWGRNVIVQTQLLQLYIFREPAGPIAFKWVKVFSTLNDCTGPFVWPSALGDLSSYTMHIMSSSDDVLTFGSASIDDCAVFMTSLPTLCSGVACSGTPPTLLIDNMDSADPVISITVSPSTSPDTYSFRISANLNDLSTARNPETHQINIFVKYADSISFN